MSQSPRLSLPYLAAAQAQKHVTVNEALLRLDCLVHLSVEEGPRAAPPVAPAEGARYIVGSAPTGVWSGHAGAVAVFDDGVWDFLAPQEGWRAFIKSDGRMLVRQGGQWIVLAPQSVERFGVNATPDATNRLAVASDASLFSHNGAGHRLVLNKAGSSDSATALFQSGFSGCAEMGLAGNNDFSFKVSSDGAEWRTAMVLDAASGHVALPLTDLAGPYANLVINGAFQVNQRGFAGGALAVNAIGYDRWRAVASGTQVTATAAGVQLTGTIQQIIETAAWRTGNFAGQTLTVSVQALSGGSLTAVLNGVSQTLTAGAATRSATFVLPAAATGNLTLTLSGAGVTFQRVQVTATPRHPGWAMRPIGVETALCQRYCQLVAPGGVGPIMPGMAQTLTRWLFPIALQQPLRADPVVGYTGVSRVYLYTGAFEQVSAVSLSSRTATTVVAATDIPNSIGSGMGTLYAMSPLPRIVLDAEL